MSSFERWTSVEGAHLVKEMKKPEGILRRTKIVATIGPKTQSVEMLEKLFTAGVNIVRMNFSHGDHTFHEQTIKNARQAASNLKIIIGIMLDTKGPEVRTGKLVGGEEVKLEKGQKFTLTTELIEGDNTRAHVDYKNITKVLKPGNIVLIDDGLVGCRVESIEETEVHCVVMNSGMLGERKGVNLPGVEVDLPAVTAKDKEDLLFGVKKGVDFIAASFIRKKEDVMDIRNVLGAKGESIKIISKIENTEGLAKFDEILEVTDGIMVARGDLGVEIPLEQVALAQKMMIAKSNVAGKPVITATQMLENMIKNPRPTRAEATDIANAVLDGTDAVMLSGETAKGDYPVEAVQTMSKICDATESTLDYDMQYRDMREVVLKKKMTVSETIASSAVKTANDINSALILTLTESGNTARLVAKYRPNPVIFAITQNKETARQLMVVRGVFPQVVGSVIGADPIIKRAIQRQKEQGYLNSGDYVIVTSGIIEGVTGQTNILKVITA